MKLRILLLIFTSLFITGLKAQKNTIKQKNNNPTPTVIDSLVFCKIELKIENDYCKNLGQANLTVKIESFDTCTEPFQIMLYFMDKKNAIKNEFNVDQILDSTDADYESNFLVNKPGYYSVSYIIKNDTGLVLESNRTDWIEINYCPSYLIPEKFIVRNDRKTSFSAIESKDIESINLSIFDASGREVFQTQNPNFVWDGTNQIDGLPCTAGNYFYSLDIYMKDLSGTIKKNISGGLKIENQ